MRKSIRGGMGLGDALYVQSIVRHLVLQGQTLKVHTAWPEVFSQLPRVETAPFSRNVNILAHYAVRKGKETKQFDDSVIQAGLPVGVELKLDWTPTDPALLERLKAYGRPILCVQLPRSPMGRKDGFGAELLPDCRVIQKIIDRLKDRTLIVQIGSGKPLFEFQGIAVDLANKTTVSQLLDVATVADGFLGYVSFIVPLAESLNKPALLVWANKGLESGHLYVRQITPQKVLYKPTSRYVMDHWPKEKIVGVVDEFLR